MKPTPTPLHRRDALLLLTVAALAGKDGRAWVLASQVTLPELLDRDELLVAEGSASLRPWPEARWAEPLRDALPRVLAEDLWRLRQPYPVTLGAKGQLDSGMESLRLIVQVDEWLARPDGAGLMLALRARWRWAPLHAPAGTALPAAGTAELALPCAAQADALADAYRRSVTLLAARIVAAS
jgi:uncharacterized lipoprotein YmbA